MGSGSGNGTVLFGRRSKLHYSTSEAGRKVRSLHHRALTRPRGDGPSDQGPHGPLSDHHATCMACAAASVENRGRVAPEDAIQSYPVRQRWPSGGASSTGSCHPLHSACCSRSFTARNQVPTTRHKRDQLMKCPIFLSVLGASDKSSNLVPLQPGDRANIRCPAVMNESWVEKMALPVLARSNAK